MEQSAFGEELRRAREKRGLSLAAVAETTRIARHHLDALERSDLDALPSGPFGKGYLRTYATLLGIDPEPLLAAYRAREAQRGLGTDEAQSRMMGELSRLVKERAGEERRSSPFDMRPSRAIVAIAVVAVGAMGWILTRSGEPRASRVERPAVRVATPVSPIAAPGRRAQAPPISTRRAPRSSPNAGSAVSGAGQATTQVASDAAPAGATGASRSAAPSAEPSAAPNAPSVAGTALAVADHGVGTGLVDRHLVGRSDRFTEGTSVTFWTLVVGGQPGDLVRHVWFRDGQPVMAVELAIGGPHWRTQSRHVLPVGTAGPWAVEARASDGRLLARQEFACERDRS